MTISVRRGGSSVTSDELSRGLGAFILAASLLLVIFAGTFPFDFHIGVRGIVGEIERQFDTRWTQYDPMFVDRGQNIVFFVPLGFGLASIVRVRRGSWAWQFAVAAAGGAIVSTAVECAQTLVSFRDPSLVDVWCNTLGSGIGAGLFVLIGPRALRVAATGLLKLCPLATPSILTAALLVYSLLQLAAPMVLRPPGDLSVWDTAVPIVVGNRAEKDRPWVGTISSLVLADRAATADESLRLHRGADPKDVFGDALLGVYRFAGKGPYKDLSEHLPPLVWGQNLPELAEGEPVQVWPDYWLITESFVASAMQRIVRTSQFTLAVVCASGKPMQHGPARIVSIGRPFAHNLTVAQDESNLAIRARTATRASPDLTIANTFAEPVFRQIVITQEHAQIVVYVDGVEAGRIEITPEAKVIWRLYPRQWFRLRIERHGFRSYAAIYRAMVLIPFAALLGATLAASRLRPRNRWMVAAGAIVGMALALEIVLGLSAGSGFQTRNLLISLAIAFAMIGVLAWWRSTRARGWPAT